MRTDRWTDVTNFRNFSKPTKQVSRLLKVSHWFYSPIWRHATSFTVGTVSKRDWIQVGFIDNVTTLMVTVSVLFTDWMENSVWRVLMGLQCPSFKQYPEIQLKEVKRMKHTLRQQEFWSRIEAWASWIQVMIFATWLNTIHSLCFNTYKYNTNSFTLLFLEN